MEPIFEVREDGLYKTISDEYDVYHMHLAQLIIPKEKFVEMYHQWIEGEPKVGEKPKVEEKPMKKGYVRCSKCGESCPTNHFDKDHNGYLCVSCWNRTLPPDFRLV